MTFKKVRTSVSNGSSRYPRRHCASNFGTTKNYTTSGLCVSRLILVYRPVYLVLLHHPIVNRKGELVTTAVTNMDIHDIARSARTFGCRGYFIVTPIEAQHELVGRILGHWQAEQSKTYHPARFEALSLVKLVKDFEEVKDSIQRDCRAFAAEKGQPNADVQLEVVLTDARELPGSVSYSTLRRELEEAKAQFEVSENDPGSLAMIKPLVVVFGTGWGVSSTFYPEVHRILAPVYGPEGAQEKGGYNHLSVRSAVAIIFDRLFGH